MVHEGWDREGGIMGQSGNSKQEGAGYGTGWDNEKKRNCWAGQELPGKGRALFLAGREQGKGAPSVTVNGRS